MKKVLRLFILAGLILLLFSGCLSLPEAGSFSLTDKITSAMGMDEMAVQVQAMEFFLLYASYGFYGGFAYESGFAEGEGTSWVHRGVDEKGSESSSEYDRIFLKDMGDGSGWWRMNARAEGESAEYEYLLNSNSDITVVRFRNRDSGEIMEYIPEQETDSDGEQVPEDRESESFEDGEDSNPYENLEYSQYSRGREKISVGAGTFTADHMVSEYRDDSDPENPVDYRSDWWISESVPGGVIKYIWTNNENGSSLASELAAILSGQTTNLNSY